MIKYAFSLKKFKKHYKQHMKKAPPLYIERIFTHMSGLLVRAYELGLNGDSFSEEFPFIELFPEKDAEGRGHEV